jgi:hypothetical protein
MRRLEGELLHYDLSPEFATTYVVRSSNQGGEQPTFPLALTLKGFEVYSVLSGRIGTLLPHILYSVLCTNYVLCSM